MRKQHPFHLTALEFMELFPHRKRFGRAATEKHLQQVAAENGWDIAEVTRRMRAWAKTRAKLEPWELVKPLPQPTIEKAKTERAPPRPIGPVPEEWIKRAMAFYQPYDEEDV